MAETAPDRKWLIASTIGVAAGLVLLDETIVGVALPTIARDLSITLGTSHWVMSAYLLTFAAFAAAAGRASDIFGLRRVFMGGTLLLAMASLLGGLAQTGTMLIAARALQGVAAAMIFPVAFAISTTAFPKDERGKALGLLAAIGTTMLAAGPLIGGVLTDAVSWRYIFYVNIPLALGALLVSWILVPPSPTKAAEPFDLAGLTTLALSIGLLVLALMQGGAWGWTGALVPGLLIAGLAGLATFVAVEMRGDAPLVDVRLFAIPTVSAAALVFLTMQMTKIVVVVFVPLYLQHRLGMSAITSGLVAVAAVFGSPLVSLPAGKAADRFGVRRPILLGVLITGLASFGMALAITLGNLYALIAALLVWGFALPYGFLPAATAIMQSVPLARQGEASGITVTSRLLGGVFGMAGASAVFAASARYDLVFALMGGAVLFTFLVAAVALERGEQPPASR